MNARPSTDQSRASLKLAFKAALNLAGGGCDLVKNRLVRVGEAALSRYHSLAPKDDQHFPAIDVVLDVEHCAGEPFVTRALAAAQGYELVLMKRERSSGSFGYPDIQRITGEFSDVSRVMFTSLADGEVCRKDIQAMRAEMAELMRALKDTDARLEAGL